MAEELRLTLLGELQITRSGKPVTGFVSGKAQALLCYLAVANRIHQRSALAGLLWGELPEDKAAAGLRVALSNLRKLVGSHLTITRQSATLNREQPYWLDVEAFRTGLAGGEIAGLAAAVGLYQGDLLDGFYVHDAPAFEEWLVAQRERLRTQATQALHQLVEHYAARGENQAGIDTAARLLALEPWREEAHRQMMLLLARAGQRGAALAQYETCRRTLAEELGVEPSEETTRLYERLLAIRSTRGQGLPPEPTPFVGRKPELAALSERLSDPDCRLLTVLGSGGIGKTRLALQAAAAQQDAFLEGVHFVPLAGVDSSHALLSAIADALHLPFFGPQDPKTQLLNQLRDKEILLLLDNFEQLLPHYWGQDEADASQSIQSARAGDNGAGELLVEILRQAPQVKLLVTSRERLNLHWEWCYEIEGLAYPLESTDNEQELEAYSAVQLFYQVARRTSRRTSGQFDKLAVTRICELVEGMPLGIELAAAGTGKRSCQQVAEEIERNLDFLATSWRDVPQRHRSLRATFEHSWRLLSPQERQIFGALSVFRGGFQAEAAQRVTGASRRQLLTLVDKSLLTHAHSGRYQMHELLRQYAAEKLASVPEAQARLHDRHCEFYVDVLERSAAAFAGADPQPALAAMRSELKNVQQAWMWALERSRLEAIGRGMQGLSLYYRLRGPFQDGERLFRTTVERLRLYGDRDETTEPQLPSVLGQLLVEWTRFLEEQRLFDKVIDAAQEAIALAERCQRIDLEVSGYLCWGKALQKLGQTVLAQTQLERALRLARPAETRPQKARSLRNLGAIAFNLQNFSKARTYYARALRIFREIGDRRGEAGTVNNSALIFLERDDYLQASEIFEQAMYIYREIGDRWGESLALINLGNTAQRYGDHAAARHYYEQALPFKRKIGDRQGESVAYVSLSLSCHHLGDNEAALEYARKGFFVATELDNRSVQAYALTFHGHALLALDRTTEAAVTYRQAIDLRRNLDQETLALEPLAGLVRTCLLVGELGQAQTHAEEILAALESVGVEGTEEPLRVYLSCYRALAANRDPRATALLATAHSQLQARIARIGDEQTRHSFSHDIDAHREILQEFARLRQDDQHSAG